MYLDFGDAPCMLAACDKVWTHEFDTSEGWLCLCAEHAAQVSENWQGKYLKLVRVAQ